MVNSNKKGDERERELVNELDARDYAVLRAPASGSATERDLPDVLAGNGRVFYAFEAKASTRDSDIYLDTDEVQALSYFADAFGARPRLAIRFDYTDWAFFPPDAGIAEVHVTDAGSYRIRHDDITDDSGDIRSGIERLPESDGATDA